MFDELVLENPHEPVSLQFAMQGPVFDEGLPLPLTIKSLEAVQGIFDKSYLVLANKTRMSAQERSLFYLQSQGIQRGSLLTTFGLAFTAAQPGLPIVSDLGPAGVWAYAKNSFQLLRYIFEAKKKGGTVTITQSGDGSNLLVNTGTQTINISNSVFQIANTSLPHYEQLASSLDPKKVTSVSLGAPQLPEIYLDLPDSRLFELPTTIGETPRKVDCEIYEFDKYSNTGRLKLFEGQSIKRGEYKFSVVGHQKNSDYIEAMLEKHVTVTCLEETVDHPLRGCVIAGLQVLSVSP
jgi:hypothetical protein